MTTSPGDAAPAKRNAAASPWIESRGFDLACFVLSPLAGLALLAAFPLGGPTLALALAALVGGPHYLASFSFFFWQDAAAYHRTRWVLHFVAPLAIVAAVAAVALAGLPGIVIFVIYFWNAWHVARQSCGILSVYRLRGGYSDERHKRVTNAAIISVSLCMALWNLAWYPQLNALLSRAWSGLPHALWVASAVAAAISLAALAASLVGRLRQGRGPTLPEWAFLATSLTLFHPYLWVRDADLATLAMLMGHFIQYLAIVWLVNRRKFERAAQGSTPAFVARAWRTPRTMAVVFFFVGALFLLLQINLAVVTITLVLLHFYLDGLFWAFRRPEIRKLLGPYLTGWHGAGAGAGALTSEVAAARPAA